MKKLKKQTSKAKNKKKYRVKCWKLAPGGSIGYTPDLPKTSFLIKNYVYPIFRHVMGPSFESKTLFSTEPKVTDNFNVSPKYAMIVSV